MKLQVCLAGAFLALAACTSGNGDLGLGPGGGGGGGADPGDGGVLPDDLPVPGDDTCGTFTCSGDLTNIVYEVGPVPGPDDDILRLTNLPFDDDPLGAEFEYLTTVTGDNGDEFDIFENNEPGTFNRYLAVYESTAGGEVTLGVVAIEGYAGFGYSGAWFDVDDLTASIPDLGLVEYVGDYVGTLTFEGNSSLFLTDGTLRMEADFTDSVLKGFIEDRDVYSVDGAGALTDLIVAPDEGNKRPVLVLNDTPITDGNFSGTVNSYDTDGSVVETGTYQGFFGGGGAAVVGGLVRAVGEYDFSGEEEAENEDEFIARDLGVFTGVCAGTSTGCAP